MTDRPEPRAKSRAAVVAVVLVVLVLLPVLYVLSFGPMVCMMHRGYFTAGKFLQAFYFPLVYLAEHWKPFKDALVWYLSFWK